MGGIAVQPALFSVASANPVSPQTTTTFIDNMRLPVHRWFRYSAGFSAAWVESEISAWQPDRPVVVFDPFVGSGTTLIAADQCGVSAIGIEAHPFIFRVARAKLRYRSAVKAFLDRAAVVRRKATERTGSVASYPDLIRRCFDEQTLVELDRLRSSWSDTADESPESELVWLALVSILRSTSHVGTAPWQYVLPNKTKRAVEPLAAFDQMVRLMVSDMLTVGPGGDPLPSLLREDARKCAGVADSSVNLVITSPPYPNNYDYADATRLEMSFMREIDSWSDLQTSVRQFLVRSCSQHVTERAIHLDTLLEDPIVRPIQDDLARVCKGLEIERHSHGGKKTYHLMVAAYFVDMARTWQALRRVCQRSSLVCFVIGDSAPYGVYVPVMEWNGVLARAAGFDDFTFEKTRDRNVKWKNRKHRVPLCEGRLWVRG